MDHIELILALGGTFAVAELANIKPPSVSNWKENNRIPDDKLIRLAPIAEARGIATRKQLFPTDWHLIWPELVNIPDESPQQKHVTGMAREFVTADPATLEALASAERAGLIVMPKK